MITFRRLGSKGRLGNQMFQYAALRGIAANNNQDWKIPHRDEVGESDYSLFKCFNMSSVTDDNFLTDVDVYPTAKASSFAFDRMLFNVSNSGYKNIDIEDYLQTDKYFSNVEDIIRKDFTFKEEIIKAGELIIRDYSNPLFLHVRRGDYLRLQTKHPVLPLSYYENALKNFDRDRPVFVLSDDPVWCREQNLFMNDRFIIRDNEHFKTEAMTGDGKEKSAVPFVDLYIMVKCNGGIIANSSMSWWGAYLQGEKYQENIIAPYPWFGEELPLPTKDLYRYKWKINDWRVL